MLCELTNPFTCSQIDDVLDWEDDVFIPDGSLEPGRIELYESEHWHPVFVLRMHEKGIEAWLVSFDFFSNFQFQLYYLSFTGAFTTAMTFKKILCFDKLYKYLDETLIGICTFNRDGEVASRRGQGGSYSFRDVGDRGAERLTAQYARRGPAKVGSVFEPDRSGSK